MKELITQLATSGLCFPVTPAETITKTELFNLSRGMEIKHWPAIN